MLELHCSCHMPEEKGDEMAERDFCNVWYHRHCMDIPSEVFGEQEIPWKCKKCANITVCEYTYKVGVIVLQANLCT